MDLPHPLIEASLLRRYKRFLIDVALPNGHTTTAHCPNPGAMLGLDRPGARVYLSRSPNPSRKLAMTLELVEIETGVVTALVGVNTMHPNRIAEEALREGRVAEVGRPRALRREVRYGERSRVDFMVEDEAGRTCFIEVKNVHLMRRPGLAEFPDCRTARGARHLAELAKEVRGGARALMLYIIQMPAVAFALAADLDPGYAAAFDRARLAGVEASAYACAVSTAAICLDRPVPILRASPDLIESRVSRFNHRVKMLVT